MKKTGFYFAAALGLLISTPAMADQVDLKKSTFQWTGSKLGTDHTGKIFLSSGRVERSGSELKSAEFVMDMASFTVEDLKGQWAGKFLGHVKSPDFFEVSKFPTSKLVLTKQVDADTVTGKLTIKDKTQPVQVDFKRSSDGAYTGRLTFDRTKFGIIYGSKNFFKKLVVDKVIANEVTVDFKVVLGDSHNEES